MPKQPTYARERSVGRHVMNALFAKVWHWHISHSAPMAIFYIARLYSKDSKYRMNIWKVWPLSSLQQLLQPKKESWFCAKPKPLDHCRMVGAVPCWSIVRARCFSWIGSFNSSLFILFIDRDTEELTTIVSKNDIETRVWKHYSEYIVMKLHLRLGYGTDNRTLFMTLSSSTTVARQPASRVGRSPHR